MSMWRIRVILPEDSGGRDALRDVLVPYQARRSRTGARGADTAVSGDVVVELHDDEPIGDLLLALHEISPQVFVSRADQPAPVVRRGIRVRQLRQGLRASS